MSKIEASGKVESKSSLKGYAERVSTRVALTVGVLVGVSVIVFNIGRNPIPLLEDVRSFGVLAFLGMFPISLFAAGFGFIVGVKAWNERVGPERQRRWAITVVPIAIAYMLFAAAIAVLLLTIIEAAFQFLALNTLQSALLAGMGTGVCAGWIVSQTIYVDSTRLLKLILVIMGGGLYLTMTNIDDPLWWQVSFSYMGEMESNVSVIFNSTLIFVGIMFLVWLGYAMSDYEIVVRHGVANTRSVRPLRVGFVVLAVALALVGAFRANLTPFTRFMHAVGTYSAAGVLGLLMVGVRWLVPGFSYEFFVESWIFTAILVAASVLTLLGRINFVGLEVIAFVLGMTWLSQFVGNVEETARRLEPDAFAI